MSITFTQTLSKCSKEVVKCLHNTLPLLTNREWGISRSEYCKDGWKLAGPVVRLHLNVYSLTMHSSTHTHIRTSPLDVSVQYYLLS